MRNALYALLLFVPTLAQAAIHSGFECSVGPLSIKQGILDREATSYPLANLYLDGKKVGLAVEANLGWYEVGESAHQPSGGSEEIEIGFVHGPSFASPTSGFSRSPQAGESCTPGEIVDVKISWASHSLVEIKKTSERVSRDFILRRGQKLEMNCSHLTTTSVTCPESGKWRSGDF